MKDYISTGIKGDERRIILDKVAQEKRNRFTIFRETILELKNIDVNEVEKHFVVLEASLKTKDMNEVYERIHRLEEIGRKHSKIGKSVISELAEQCRAEVKELEEVID